VASVLLQLMAIIGAPLDARFALLGVTVVLAGAGMALMLRRAFCAETPAHDDVRIADQRRTPALAAMVAETVFVAAGRPEPRAPARSPWAASA